MFDAIVCCDWCWFVLFDLLFGLVIVVFVTWVCFVYLYFMMICCSLVFGVCFASLAFDLVY